MKNNPVELLDSLAAMEARESFYAFRQHISCIPQKGRQLKLGWWQRKISNELQQFYDDMLAGLRPKIVIQAPPQHGKSTIITDFIAWLSGKHPDFQTIYASFSDRLGVRANLRLRRIYRGDKFKQAFPEFNLGGQQNNTILEHGEAEGSFRNTTVLGSITGETLNIGVVDDPIKGRDQANSLTYRDKVWDWFTDDFFTRFDENAGLICILTRWHVDDPIGRLLEKHPDIKLISYPALATEDEEFRKEGDALFPEHKSREFLLERKEIMDPANWAALYQQQPYIAGGEVFDLSKCPRYESLPPMEQITQIIHSWDTAFKKDQHNDPSVCTIWYCTKTLDYLAEVHRGRWNYPELRRKVFELAQTNPHAVLIEDKASGQVLIQELKHGTKANVIPIKVGAGEDKETRARACSYAFASGRIVLPKSAPWLAEFESELASFPKGKHDDQVDSVSQALNWLRRDTNQDFMQMLDNLGY